MNKEMITISRYWNNPQIKIVVTNESMTLSMPLDDFVDAVYQEIGSVRWIVRDATFEARMLQAVKNVIAKVKKESAKAV